MNRVLFVFLIVGVGAALIAGLLTVGGPGYARMEKNDNQRVTDLNRLYGCLVNLVGDVSVEDADEICRNSSDPRDLRDPATQDPYEYTQTPDGGFKVCATFQTKNFETNRYIRRQQIKFDGMQGCRSYIPPAPKS
jgi:hypothetical protein